MGVNGAEVAVLDCSDDEGLCRLAEGQQCGRPEFDLRLAVLGDPAYGALEWCLWNEELSRTLVLPNLADGFSRALFSLRHLRQFDWDLVGRVGRLVGRLLGVHRSAFDSPQDFIDGLRSSADHAMKRHIKSIGAISEGGWSGLAEK